MNKTGKIYKMYNQYGVYFGSTTKTLKERFNKHKINSKNKKCTSHILFKNGCDVTIELLEEVEFDDIKELRIREAYYIKNLECINKQIPNRTHKETNKAYYETHKEQIKQYREKNKKKIKEQAKDYRETNKNNISEKRKVKITCDCGLVVRKDNILRHCRSKKHLKYIENSNI